MASVIIAQIVENTVVIWTDANPADPNYARQNFIEIGSQCIVMHDDFLPWVSITQPFSTDPTLMTLPVDELANGISQRLQNLATAPQNRVGHIVAGFTRNGSAAIIGLHSINRFVPTRYFTSVCAGLPVSIWAYLASILQTIPVNRDNAIDMCLIAGLVYNRVVFSPMGLPAGSAIAILSPGQNPYWMSDAEITQRQTHNNRRLHSLQGHLINQLQELSK